jgi:hypothetical protein
MELSSVPLLCVRYSEKLLMMDRGTMRNMYSFIPKNKFEKLVHLAGFIVGSYHDARSRERQVLQINKHKHSCRARLLVV